MGTRRDPRYDLFNILFELSLVIMKSSRNPRGLNTASLLLLMPIAGWSQSQPGESPALGTDRITQADITGGQLSEDEIREAGQKIFSTPFNKLDGYGDGPVNPQDSTSPGGRPTLQGNGTFLRINGLDSQTCMECHSVGSNAVSPFRFGVGGVGSGSSNAMFMPRNIDVADEAALGQASFDGRFINPPFLFGSGGVELLGKEMTRNLQRLKQVARSQPGVRIDLDTHGVSYGSIEFNPVNKTWDTSQVNGIDADLVVRPFGRKGEFASVRAFDLEALEFHFGMQPTEVVGRGVDADGDGVANEILEGEVSALHLFNVTLRRPGFAAPTPESEAGLVVFEDIGCADCHIPQLSTDGQALPLSSPEIETAPFQNAFRRVNLASGNAGFDALPSGGLAVPLFSDLRRHDMGPGLAEDFGNDLDSEFLTARLWGVADTAPYLHDGRATTLTEAILAHGGDAQLQRDAFDQLGDQQKVELLSFLRGLRTPLDPTGGI